MKRATALLMLLVFSNLAVAHPFASGGGSESSSEETDLTMIILAVVVAGVATLIVSDILADKDGDSPDNTVYGDTEAVNEETGVNWENVGNNSEAEQLPLLAISVFHGENGKNLSSYFSSLILQGNQLYYQLYPSPVSFGTMEPQEAAETGFSFLNCQWFITADSSGLALFTEDSDGPQWLYSPASWDSATVRDASSSFVEYATNPAH